MKQSTLSMFVFGVYFSILGLILMIFPNQLITFFGFDPVTDVWVRIFGLILVILGYYYYMATKEEAYNFYKWTVYGRFPIFFVFLIFAILGLAPPILVLFGAIDTSGAVWTRYALKKENKTI